MLAERRLVLPGLIGSAVALEDILEGVHRVADGDAAGGRVMVEVR
jgi:hypothetical protein